MGSVCEQIWVGGQDFALVLRSIGGWHVGCFEERDHIVAVQHAIDSGYVAKRIHYAPMIPAGAEAWELTDAGLEHLGQIGTPEMMGGADKMRSWYRSHKKKWLSEHPEVRANNGEARRLDGSSATVLERK